MKIENETKVKSKITKILNYEEKSKWKVRIQKAISKAQTHHTNGYQLYSWIGTGIFLCGKWCIKPGFLAS